MKISAKIATGAATLISQQRQGITTFEDVTSTKSSEADPVTIVDQAAEDYISAQLASLRPDDGLVGEEGSARPTRSGVRWIVDPIDGTVNFLYGIPQYAVSIAAEVDGRVVAGAVVNVATGQQFYAARDSGAWTRQAGQPERLRATSKSDLTTTLVATGFSYHAYRRRAQAALLATILPQVRDIRRCGSAALDLCALAAGQVDAYYEHGLNSWDFAAGILIAREAGAKVWAPPLARAGAEGEVLIAAAPKVADQVYAMMQQAGGLAPM